MLRVLYPSFGRRGGRAVTRHGEGEGFGAENVTLGAFHGRIRSPCGLPRPPAASRAPACRGVARGRTSRESHVSLGAFCGRSSPPCNVLRHPMRLAVTRRNKGERALEAGSSPSRRSVTDTSPSAPAAASSAPSCHETGQRRRFRGRKRHPWGFPRQNPSPLKSPVTSQKNQRETTALFRLSFLQTATHLRTEASVHASGTAQTP